MKQIIASSIALSLVAVGTSLLTISNANAGTPANSSGHAVTLCKEQASMAHEGYERSKTSKIKLTRGVYKVKLRVITESGSEQTLCEIDRDGNISYTKA